MSLDVYFTPDLKGPQMSLYVHLTPRKKVGSPPILEPPLREGSWLHLHVTLHWFQLLLHVTVYMSTVTYYTTAPS